jgi:putative flippase GtrA
MFEHALTVIKKYRRIGKFVLVGGGVALFGGIQMYLYVEVLHMEQILAYILQTFLSLQINFNINDFWTWGDWRKENGGYSHRWIKFHLSRFAVVLFDQIGFGVLVLLGFHYLATYTILIILGFTINYITSCKFVFKRKGVQNNV